MIPSLRRTQDPAAGAAFHRCVAEQCKPVILQGLLASHHTKQLLVEGGLSASLGTVGCERLWRNWQRRARNLARSHGDDASVSLVTASRWLREVAARSSAAAGRASALAQAEDQLRRALHEGDACLHLSSAEGAENLSIYKLYLEGRL